LLSAAEAVSLIPDGATVAIAGAGGGVLEPDALILALSERFRRESHPRDLVVVHSMGPGDKASRGMSLLANPRLIRKLIGGHFGNSPAMGDLIRRNEIEAYNLPLGVLSQLFREAAAGRPGLLTKTGLGTFVDPRMGGSGLNQRSREAPVELVEVRGEEYLLYRAIPIDFALVRGSVADPGGNVTFDDEPSYLDMLETCMAAARGRGNRPGTALVQVKRLTSAPLHPKAVRIPSLLLGGIVHHPEQWQTHASEHDDVLAGNVRIADGDFAPMPMSWRKVIARRAAQFVKQGDVVNLGVGVADGVASILQETGTLPLVTMTNEHGIVGGVTSRGMTFGASMNFDSVLSMPNMIDLYQGGLLDVAFLGFGEVDQSGNVNVSVYGNQIVGSGGFIDITQNARRLVFCGSFTASGLKVEFDNGAVVIAKEGRINKFVSQVEHVTFNGKMAAARGQEVHIVTERAVFALTEKGVELIEIAPGVDAIEHIQAHCGFPLPRLTAHPMPHSLFKE